jgi:hypothetical protein
MIDLGDSVDNERACSAGASRRGQDAQFCFPERWYEPGRSEWRRGFGADTLDVEDLDADGIDIRDRAWWLLRLAGAGKEDRDEMMLPFLNGFWKISDGMSSPIWRHTLAWAGMPKHPVFVGHDWDYFTGAKTRAQADRDMLRRMEMFGWSWNRRMVVYAAVRLCGAAAWRRHARLRRSVAGYGTDAWIRERHGVECFNQQRVEVAG